MALRFAIIKVIETYVGNMLENVISEHDEDEVFGNIVDNLRMTLHDSKGKPFIFIGEKKWTETEVLDALERCSMALRFAIIKVVKTYVGNMLENVVYEHDEDEVSGNIVDNLRMILHDGKDKPFMGEKKWTETEVIDALERSWKKTITNFKKVTVKIF
jgi:hypothetical protein